MIRPMVQPAFVTFHSLEIDTRLIGRHRATPFRAPAVIDLVNRAFAGERTLVVRRSFEVGGGLAVAGRDPSGASSSGSRATAGATKSGTAIDAAH